MYKKFIKLFINYNLKKNIFFAVIVILDIIGVVLWCYSLTPLVTILFLNCIALLTYSFYQSFQLIKQIEKTNFLINDSNKVKAAFLANMSHEVRTPLNAINGFSEILLHAQSADEKNYLIQSIRKNCYELTNFIDNILDISKIEFGRLYIENQTIRLRSIIDEVQLIMTARAHAKGLQFIVEATGKLPRYVFIDKSRVQQILINLIGNAIKFTENGFIKLKIEAKKTTKGKTKLYFLVIDTGIGISEPDQLDLFQSFSQADNSFTRRYGGVGLGLALSRRLAQQLSGDVVLLKSQLKYGSSFCFQMPLENVSDVEWVDNLFSDLNTQPVQLNLPYDFDLSKKKVLLVEDSEDNREIFHFFLKSVDLEVHFAENGEIAIEKISCENYDFILMDVQLPIVDGLEATRIIRSMGFKNPIIALTAHASIDAKSNCLNAGCNGVINKPVTQNMLLQNILYILKKNSLQGNENDDQELLA